MVYVSKNYRENADRTVIGGELAITADGKITKDGVDVDLSPEPYTLPAATTTTLGGVKKAAHVDPAAGTVADVVNALIDAGIMA